ncbi:NADH-quinone oxidoreductase subunit C [Streptomyces sp. NPDC020917]|uniref:NADH-quinone oxidoreductase subunit C n=1 Tax=Streptomyces sp. NPDC020917 TaxID=3365102 RepID=UPI0037BDB1EB
MSGFDRLPEAAAELFGEGATAAEAYDLLTVDVPAASWVAALTTARDDLGCTFFDWLSAVDEPGTGFRVCAHVVRLQGGVRRLLMRTTVPHDAPALPTATGVYAGAAWHERETHEMFGVEFPGHPGLAPLLLPDEFEGHPLRKDFVLAARVAKAWPGAKEPGESHDGGPKRRQMLPPGVPDPNEWGPLKGQLPPAPARPARGARAAGAGGAAGAPGASGAAGAAGERPARRMRSASEGSASQAAEGAERPARRMRSASGSTSQRAEAPGEAAATPGAGAEQAPARKRVPDAPWEQPREPEPRETASSEPAPSQPASSEPAETAADTVPGSDAGPAAETPDEGRSETPDKDRAETPDQDRAENPDEDRDEPPAGGDSA